MNQRFAETRRPLLVGLVGGSDLERRWIHAALRGSDFLVATEVASATDVVAPNPGDVIVLTAEDAADAVSSTRRLRDQTIGVPILILTAGRWRGLNEQVAEAGAEGTVLKTGSVEDLLGALRTVAAGRPSYDRRHPPRPVNQTALSPRERQVLRLVAEGATNREIGAALGIGPETVKTVLARACAKLRVRGRNEAAATAHGLGLL